MFDGLLAAARGLAGEPSGARGRAVRRGRLLLLRARRVELRRDGERIALDAESDSVQAAARDRSADGANRAQQLAWLWQELPVPVIAAVQGAAYGGGFHIALGADIRIIAPDARIAFVEITWGLVPDLSGTQALRRLVPLDVAKKLIFTGEPISGEQAVALHLGTELSERAARRRLRPRPQRSPAAAPTRSARRSGC